MCKTISSKKKTWRICNHTFSSSVIDGCPCREEFKNCFPFLLSVDWRTIPTQDDSLQNVTASPIENKLVQIEKSSQAGLIAIILLASVVCSAIIAVVVFVFCYRKRLKEKFTGDSKSQKEFRQFELENIPPSSNLIPASEPETPNQTDGNNRTFTFSRGRLSSTGSTNSTTPLLRYRTGSYRSRFSSGVSSRIDSNIAEGI